MENIDIFVSTTTTNVDIFANQSTTNVQIDIVEGVPFAPSTLLEDYGFVDNSANWDTAFSWGDHALAGYATTGDLAPYLRSDIADVKTIGDLFFLDDVASTFGSTDTGRLFHTGNDLVLRLENVASNNDFFIQNGGSTFATFLRSTGGLLMTGSVTASSLITSGGTSSDFVKGDGTLDSSSYLSDAPSDGNEYVRLNGAWSIATGGGASELSDLSDVNTSTPTNRNILIADGTDWESRALVEADISDLQSYLTSETDPIFTASQAFNITAGDITNLGNLSGINTGDQTSIVGITGTRAQFDTAVTDGDFLYVGDVVSFPGFTDLPTDYGVTLATVATSGDHTDLSNIGTNSHAQIDAHIADSTIHFTQASISITESQISDLGNYAESLSELSDVVSATNTNRFALMANGTTGYVGRALVEADISDLQSYLTTEINDLSAAVVWVNVPDANITQSSVTQHQSALSITESQISDLGSYAEQLSELSDVVSATNTNRFVLVANGTTGYVGRALLEADISDLQSYLTSEVNDLSSSVTWVNVPDANITQSSVTQHQAALSITESQISDLQSYLLSGDVDLAYTASTRTITNTAGDNVVLPLFTSTDAGLIPLSGGGTTNFLRADGTWAAPSGGGSAPTLSKSITIPDPAADDDATIFYTPVAITVTAIYSHIVGTTNVVFNIQHASTRTGTGLDVFTSDITLTSTAGQTNNSGFNDETIPANSWVWLEVTSVSGTPDLFHTTIIYTED